MGWLKLEKGRVTQVEKFGLYAWKLELLPEIQVLERWIDDSIEDGLEWSETGTIGCRCRQTEATTFVVSKANSCWQMLNSTPFLFWNNHTIITANYHPTLPKFRKAKFGKRLFTSFSRFGVRGELEPPGVSVQDVTFCSPKPSASVPETYTQRKCLWNEVMCLGSSFISSSTSKERERIRAFLRKSCGLEN